MTRKHILAGALVAPALAGWLLTAGSSVSAAAPIPEQEKPAPEGFALNGDATSGRTVYTKFCRKCHGKRGNGQGTMAKDLDPKPRDFTDQARMSARTDWQILLGIREGGPSVGLSEQMTGWQDTLSDQEMRDVAAYIREFAK